MTENKPLELYFHIPFCLKKCDYCDFLSFKTSTVVWDSYMKALIQETKEKSEPYKDCTIISIFIGGGTPSLVPGKWISKLLATVKENYQLSDNAEITIEVNPGTVNEEKLRQYYEAGINRLSIGLQSALDKELKTLGRIHDFSQFQDSYDTARMVGFSNVNVDIMSALPFQTLSDYKQTLKALLELEKRPEHISAYSLILEEGTPFFEKQKAGLIVFPDEDSDREMYELTENTLTEAGFSRYEISNYAIPGYECKHNCGYWRRRDYIGFGIGAASLYHNIRFSNGRDLSAYINNPMGVILEKQILTKEEQMEEFFFLGLRLLEGVSKKEFWDYFACDVDEIYGSVIQKHMKDGLLQGVPKKRDSGEEDVRLQLTKRGTDLSNYVMASFLF
ncbi:radical SAM family heme chaperone HemW [Lachnospiraceae bacterium OttesenSCG-928-D06]|nr:radical SAM family heme chaperone HemW [Lachnospiraceae bacterium OttesenSCG-928-D06]